MAHEIKFSSSFGQAEHWSIMIWLCNKNSQLVSLKLVFQYRFLWLNLDEKKLET